MSFKPLALSLLCCSLAVLQGCSGGSSESDFASFSSIEEEGLATDTGAAADIVGDGPMAGTQEPASGDTSGANTGSDATDGSADPLLEDPFTAQASAGAEFVAPETAVDCDDTLPCRWVSESGSFAITITRAANTASLDRLEVLYRVDVLHDTSVLLGNSLDARGANGQRYKPILQRLGDSRGASPVALLAGDFATGSLTYDTMAADASLSYLNIDMIDNGLAYSAEFSKLPTGSARSEPADCASTLPCTWTSAGGDVSVTLVAAGGYDVNNRLGVNFLVESAADDQVVLDTGSVAIGNDGSPIEGLNHRLGSELGVGAISHRTFSGVALAGQVSFYRTATRPSSLSLLDLSFYRDSQEPRWNPRFNAVPLQ